MPATAPSEWRPVHRVRTHELVLRQIEAEIQAGRLRAGDRLPGERRLAELLEVSRASVREALRVLEALGVLRSQNGSGADAGAILTSRPADGLADLLRINVGLSNFTAAEVIDARTMIERSAAASAARAAGPGELERLGEALGRLEDRTLTAEEFSDLDTEFHVRVAEASGNRLVADFMRALRDAMRRHALEAIENLGAWPDAGTGLQEGHARIHAAIAARDPAAAAAAVDAHVGYAYPDLERHRGQA